MDRALRSRAARGDLVRVREVLFMTTPPAPTSDDSLVTVKLDRDVVARLAALKVTHGRRSYSEVIRDLLRIK